MSHFFISHLIVNFTSERLLAESTEFLRIMRNGDENADDIAGRFTGTYTGADARSCKYGTTCEITDEKGKGLPESGKGEALEIPHSPEKEPVSCLTDWHYTVSETFSVVMTKDPGAACTEQFNILGSFFTTDILSDYSHLDMGNGLLLKIFHKDGTATEFNRFSQFASFSSSSAPSVTAPFRAELSANPAETVVEGPFSKDVILKITYN